MKKVLLVLTVLFTITCNIYSAPGWFTQNSGTSETLNDVFFINSLTGWAVGDTGIIIKTTNGGINWFRQYNPNDKELLAVRFLNENTGWAVGGQPNLNPVFCIDHMIILKTTNGGTNWTIQFYSSMGDIFYGLSVVNQNVVYVSSYGAENNSCMSSWGGIIKTSNGGTNWTGIPDLGIYVGFKSVHFINQYTGWAAGNDWSCTYSMSRIIKTTNAGENWSITYFDSSNYWSSPQEGKMMFIDELNGYIIDHCIKKTTNGGYNWFDTDSASTMGAKGFFFINKDTGWMVRSNPIKRTDNGSMNWSLQYTPITSWLYSIYFINELTGWTVGTNGTILKTITGGLTSVKQMSTLIPDKNALLQNYPNPFNPTSKIKMQIAKSSNVRLIVYDALGKELTTLIKEHLNPGTYEVEFDGSSYPSGVYFYKLQAVPDGRQAGDFAETKKMLLLK